MDNPQMHTVTDADRRAALNFMAQVGRVRADIHGTAILAGEWDHTKDIQAFAAHRVEALEDEAAARIAHLEAEVERLREAVVVCDAAIREMFRYYDGGETRGSYDGKPERAQLRKAGYAARAALKSTEAK